MKRLAMLVVMIGAVGVAPRAQQPAFEVASIKVSAPSERGGRQSMQPGGRFVATNARLDDLVLWAWRVHRPQLAGGPPWMTTARFDITALSGDPAISRPRMALMLRRLLEERFKLRVHTETREDAVFHLLAARRDGRLGPQLRTSAVDCRAFIAERDVIDVSQPIAGADACQPRNRMSATPTSATMAIARVGLPMSDVAATLIPFARRIVLDRTGLEGLFDLDLSFSPDNVLIFTADGAPPTVAQPGEGRSLNTALQEQLGLKLEASRGPVEVLVIDSAELPTEN